MHPGEEASSVTSVPTFMETIIHHPTGLALETPEHRALINMTRRQSCGCTTGIIEFPLGDARTSWSGLAGFAVLGEKCCPASTTAFRIGMIILFTLVGASISYLGQCLCFRLVVSFLPMPVCPVLFFPSCPGALWEAHRCPTVDSRVVCQFLLDLSNTRPLIVRPSLPGQ